MKREEVDCIPISRMNSTKTNAQRSNRSKIDRRSSKNRQGSIAANTIRKRKRKHKIIRIAILTIFACIMIACLIFLFVLLSGQWKAKAVIKLQMVKERIEQYESRKPEMTVDLLTLNPTSRPGTELKDVKNIFVHYTANPGTNAVQNRSYFEQLKDTKERSASAHFIIGYEGDIIQCVPLEEIAYAVKTRNEDSISIECCYIEEDGSFTQETYDSLIQLLAWLTGRYGLEKDDILRHYDCGGKKCPLYYTENEAEWIRLKDDVEKKMKGQEKSL